MEHSLTRIELVIGSDGLNKLRNSKVIVFGVGGVGGFAVEALARAGVGEITIVDNDTVSLTNLNRQIIATYDTIGQPKVEVMKQRIQSINKDCNVITRQVFVNNDNIEELIGKDMDYVIDAIDTVSAKLGLAEYCYKNDIKIISSMGTGNKIDPSKFKVSDVFKTQVCPLAKVMRHELRKRGVKKLKVVYSEEMPRKPKSEYTTEVKGSAKRPVPGSVSFVPPVSGMIMAGEVIKDISGINKKK
ncbi:tRNA threonylcarbamoyladenosine dehydratase [uncultured Clostridium sp.]|uniref:tRNA threonylcarbamoyladenosine dehydratase n=1 Tax=uncultured Clostridium sp. TaxID=59620 RepID=UPI0025E1DEBE|nr:tRNA threonylcarbamoyladenosine dehydratase [uncultured Clostridium sp.]